MSEKGSNQIISPEELEAAIAEIEAMGPADQAQIPSLDDGRGEVVPVPVPVPTMTPRAAGETSGEAAATGPVGGPSSADTTSGGQAAPAQPCPPTPAEAPSSRGFPGRLIGAVRRWRSARRGAAAEAPTEGKPGPKGESVPSNWLLRLIDTALAVVNRPFWWVPPEARRVLGLGGVVTIIVSILVGTLYPALVKRTDPVAFVYQKRAEQSVTKSRPDTQDSD